MRLKRIEKFAFSNQHLQTMPNVVFKYVAKKIQKKQMSETKYLISFHHLIVFFTLLTMKTKPRNYLGYLMN